MLIIRLKHYLLILLMFVCATTLSCSSGDKKDDITVKIVCSGGIFSGFTMPDNGEIDLYEGYLISGTSYYYEITYNDIDSIYVSATIDPSIDASLSIFIYRADSKVKQDSFSVTSTSSDRTLTLQYEYGEEEQSSSE